ncbi:TPA: hypothetical protein ACYLN4_000511 [Burkholderia lata]
MNHQHNQQTPPLRSAKMDAALRDVPQESLPTHHPGHRPGSEQLTSTTDVDGVAPQSPLTCPDTARRPDDIVGCGSANVTGPDSEGFHDCLDCGMFFKATAA